MNVSKLPSVESLVKRIKNRIKHPKIDQNKETVLYRSPVKQLHDQQIAQMPILVWDKQNNPYHQKQQQQTLLNNYYYQQGNNLIEENKQTVRNLAYCNTQQDIPRVPHRKHEGDLMKRLIYDAHYAEHEINPPIYVNYDHQYHQHQKKYFEAQSQATNFYKRKSRSVIAPKVERDRMSGKKYPKFVN